MVQRVVATDATLALIDELKGQYGDFFFHQSGGCCDNSAANAYLPGELTIGGVPFYIGANQFEYWKHTQLIIDVIEGSGGTFSLEGPTGKAFLTRSRVFNDDESRELGLL